MKKSIITATTILAMLFGTAMLNSANAQIYLFHDPFGEEAPIIEEKTDTYAPQLPVDNEKMMAWLATALWCAFGWGVLRYHSVRKSKRRRERMERNAWTVRRAAAAMVVLLFLSTAPAHAQIFLDDESMENSRVNGLSGSLPIVPTLDVTYDQYAPLGGEVLALGLLGGAYLLGKKRKEK